MALELFVVSARTNKRHHHHHLKQEHVLRTRTRSLYAIEAPVTGYRRKISVQTAVPLSGESTLICVNTLWRVAKPLVLSLRNFQNQCWSETLL